jgi:hypothetical protein
VLWVALAGIVLQVAGLFVAIRGVWSTYSTVFKRPMLPDLRADVARWWRVRVRRQRPATAIGVGAARVSSIAGRGFVTVRPPDPGSAASSLEQVQYLRLYVEGLATELDHTRKHAQEQLDAAERRLLGRFARVDEEMANTKRDVETIGEGVLGSDGRGLRWAAVGLSLTLLGVALTAAGLQW